MKSIFNYVNESLMNINESVNILLQGRNLNPVSFTIDFKTYQQLLRLENKNVPFTNGFNIRKSDDVGRNELSDINEIETLLNSFGRSLNE